ncbi:MULTISPECIES: DUF1493 family protein [Yersinia]|nr:DUF1493 family protein [Yersinia intermedia]MDA5510787.1 DUF1493 family protein [Yersinia intermedia]
MFAESAKAGRWLYD